MGKIQKEIGLKKKANKEDPCVEELQKKTDLENVLQESQKTVDAQKLVLDDQLNKIGNIIHDTVPVFDDEVNNKVSKSWGEIKENVINETKGHAHHH
jgi:seryl-tRNA synthetase